VLLKCFKGCDFEAIIFALGFERDLYLASGSVRVAKDAGHERKDRIACASLLWDSALPAVGTLAHEYLRSRGIRIEPPWTLRFSMLKHRPSGLWLPAMVAAVVDVNAEFVGIHRTYLRPDGNGKANVEPVKMSLGPIGGGAVRLSPISENLILCEGIETGLSIAQAIPDASVWVALSSSGLRIIELPRQVRTVTIAADNDETGEKARAVAQRLVGEGRTVRIAQPSIGGFDFNDVLQKTH
jgi:hypothetical protein